MQKKNPTKKKFRENEKEYTFTIFSPNKPGPRINMFWIVLLKLQYFFAFYKEKVVKIPHVCKLPTPNVYYPLIYLFVSLCITNW